MLSIALSLAAHAAPPELSFDLELGQLHNGDPAFDLFSERNGMPSRGGQIGVRVASFAVVQASAHHLGRGVTISPADGQSISSAYQANEWTAGLRVDHLFADVFAPYAAVHGMVLQGTMKFDDDAGRDGNPNELAEHGVHPGALFLGGVELRGPQGDRKWTAGTFFEAGYGLVARADYGAFGDMKPGGFAMRAGIGLRLF